MASLLTAAQTYRLNQICSASPLELLLMAYDAALIGCAQRDLKRTTDAVSVLRNALSFSYDPNIAMGLFRLYQYCAELARKGEYDQAAHLLRELRDAWSLVRDRVDRETRTAQSSNAFPPAAAPGVGYTAGTATMAAGRRPTSIEMPSVAAVA
jgi:flagellin-specific chaperone FliS